MYKKALGMFLMGTLFIFCSCVDDTYDLKKDITTDVEIRGNKLAIPLGSLQPFMLDSIIGNIDDVEADENGVFCLKMGDNFYMEKHIRPIELSIPRQSIEQKLSIPSTFAIQGVQEGVEVTIPIPFEQEKTFEIHNDIPKQFTRIHKCHFTNEMAIEMNIQLEGLEALQATSADLDLTITFPPILGGLREDDPDITISEDKVGTSIHIKKSYPTEGNQGLIITLYCSEFDFTKELLDGVVPEEINEKNAYLSYTGKIKANGQIEIKANAAAGLANGNNMGFRLDVSSSTTSVQTIRGGFTDEFYQAKSTFALAFSEELVSFVEQGNVITLSSPRVAVTLDNAITIPLETIEMEAYGKDKEDNILEETMLEANFDVEAAHVDNSTGEVIVETSKWLLTTHAENVEAGDYQVIETPNLENWLKSTPDSVTYTIHPIIDKTVIKDIRIDHNMSLNAEYQAVIPFSFDSLHICYSDTIPADIELEESEETTISNMGLKIKMKVASTLPLGMKINITALDEEDNPIDDFTFEEITFAPCLEENATLQTTSNKANVELSINNREDNNIKIHQLKFDFEIDNGFISLKKNQGIQVSDLVIEVSGDIVTDKNE